MRLIDADVFHSILSDALNKPGVTSPIIRSLMRTIIYSLDAMPTVDAVPVCVLKEILMRYFDIGDSYHFELTRVKEAFEVGTMSLDDFQEWTEEDVNDLVEYIKKNCADGEHKGGDE